jgi:hypothetical protein
MSALREAGSWCRTCHRGPAQLVSGRDVRWYTEGWCRSWLSWLMLACCQVVVGGSLGGQPVLTEAEIKLSIVCGNGFCKAEEHHGELR